MSFAEALGAVCGDSASQAPREDRLAPALTIAINSQGNWDEPLTHYIATVRIGGFELTSFEVARDATPLALLRNLIQERIVDIRFE